jgi:hypothetical protein
MYDTKQWQDKRSKRSKVVVSTKSPLRKKREQKNGVMYVCMYVASRSID